MSTKKKTNKILQIVLSVALMIKIPLVLSSDSHNFANSLDSDKDLQKGRPGVDPSSFTL